MSNRWDEAFKVAQANPQVVWRDQDAPRPAIAQPKNFVSPGPKPEPNVPASSRPGKHGKYNNVKVVVDGHTFDSGLEARVYGDLKLRERNHEIKHLELQPVFLLQDGFKDNTGKKHRAITYIADFMYTDRMGTTWVVDAKGVETETFKLKMKLFLKLYPQYRFELVREAHKTKRKGRKG